MFVRIIRPSRGAYYQVPEIRGRRQATGALFQCRYSPREIRRRNTLKKEVHILRLAVTLFRNGALELN